MAYGRNKGCTRRILNRFPNSGLGTLPWFEVWIFFSGRLEEKGLKYARKNDVWFVKMARQRPIKLSNS